MEEKPTRAISRFAVATSGRPPRKAQVIFPWQGEGRMAEPLFEPIPITYRGLLADWHFVDAQQFGRSLIGASKLANSVCHELFWENITHDPRSYHIRFVVGPSKQ